MEDKLNSNIRCIEIIDKNRFSILSVKLNSNIRCIEIAIQDRWICHGNLLNSNIRCIEIEEYGEYGIPVVVE